jgi:hypothetical protein
MTDEKDEMFLGGEPPDRDGPYEFHQQDYGAVMPEGAMTRPGTCSQCGRKGEIAEVRMVGLGQDVTSTPCAECVTDMAFGAEALPMVETTIKTKSGEHKSLGLYRPNATVFEK